MLVKLKNIFLFKDLDDETIKTIEEFTSSHKLLRENIIFYEGEESKYLYLLSSGIVKLYKTSSHNKEIVLKYFHPNELIAEVANFEHMPYPATAKAYTDVEILKIDFDKLKNIIFSNMDLTFKIQSSLIKKIKNLEKLISSHLVLDSKERVAQYIHDHPEDFFKTKNIEIAEILNITPETFSRILKSLKSEEALDLRKKTINKEKLKLHFL